ncbi:MAG TPA: HD domain-containing protein [Desulfosporosinus sp.]
MAYLKFSEIEKDLRLGEYLATFEHATDNNSMKAFFFEPDGIHGLGHMKRVLLINLIFAYLENLNSRDINILVNCSLFHDIGRINNSGEALHGTLSYEKAVKHNLLKDSPEDEDSQITKLIITTHCIDDSLIPSRIKDYKGIEDKERCLKLLNIFKDADGLDRIRFGGLDVRYLRTKHAPELVLLAEKLVNDIR